MDPSKITPEMMAFAQKQMANMSPQQMVRSRGSPQIARAKRNATANARIFESGPLRVDGGDARCSLTEVTRVT
jgi:hypothetical protein|tara:strand:+ start:2695 stop:2913 length:219 start_codon:yes stop_codon:yes gene_type:complete